MLRVSKAKVSLVGILTGVTLASALLLSACSSTSTTSLAPLMSSAPANSTTSKVAAGNTGSTNTSTSGVKTTANQAPVEGKQGTFKLAFDKEQVAAGEVFTVQIMLTTAVESRGASAALEFDPTAMQCEEVTEGAFFKDWASQKGVGTIGFPSPKIDNTKGTVSSAGVAVVGQTAEEMNGDPSPGAKGTGSLLVYKMTALPGVNKMARLTISEIQATDVGGKNLNMNDYESNSGLIQIGNPQ